MLGNISGELAKVIKTQDTQKKILEGLLKNSKDDKELGGLLKSMQKLMNAQNKILQTMDKKAKKEK